ncbi:MAG TPA: RNA polymerase subunit sigma-70, partial [Phycisphaerales bacterium]|nr:RNA polymerase subunit sigma-70 [Phycisphaerales bacterium]
MEELATELSAGLVRLRKAYVDAAEALAQTVESDQTYPYEFVVFRLTQFRPPGGEHSPMNGEELRQDLLQLMLDVSASFDLRAEDYAEPACDNPTLARRFHISTKTIQRWRKLGLAARNLVFPDGTRRMGFLESSVKWFVKQRRRQVLRSMRFRQMTAFEREEIIRRARRMATLTHCCLSDVAHRLAERTGRAVETIRYTIRKHDTEHPDNAVFPYLASPLGDQEKDAIYRAFLRGVPVPALAEQYNRTRGSVYRIINEMRARRLVDQPINFMFSPEFDLPNADELILGEEVDYLDGKDVSAKPAAKPPPDLPPYLRALYRVPLLTAVQEKDLFRRYNYLKYKADRLRRKIDAARIRTGQLREVEHLLLRANGVKNQIIRANLRLVVS